MHQFLKILVNNFDTAIQRWASVQFIFDTLILMPLKTEEQPYKES